MNAEGLSRSAANLAAADEAIGWATDREWAESVDVSGETIRYRISDTPAEIIRRIIMRVIAELCMEGNS